MALAERVVPAPTYRVVRSILRNEGDVEDVLQEAYLAAFEQLESFEGRARTSTWLVRIAVNKALDRLRRASRLVGLDGWPEEDLLAHAREEPAQRDPEAQSAARELTQLLAAAIDALPARFRSVYVLREVEGMSTEETATGLGLESATVKTRLHRARARLREDLERRVGASARETFCFGAHRCDALVGRVFRGACRQADRLRALPSGSPSRLLPGVESSQEPPCRTTPRSSRT